MEKLTTTRRILVLVDGTRMKHGYLTKSLEFAQADDDVELVETVLPQLRELKENYRDLEGMNQMLSEKNRLLEARMDFLENQFRNLFL